LTLLVAPPRGKAFDLVLKAAVEVGFTRIQPILTQYGVARPEGSSENWEQTLVAAMKQSANPWLPELAPPIPFAQALSYSAKALFGASPGAEALPTRQPLHQRLLETNAVFIGPESGFSRQEEEELLDHDAFPVTIGPAIMRVETAVPALAGYLYGAAAIPL
jgi:16S rRNA (uracil1498-N3)-methyltransferase